MCNRKVDLRIFSPSWKKRPVANQLFSSKFRWIHKIVLIFSSSCFNFFLQVYKSSSKRKSHILKNHPGKEPPPSARDKAVLQAINGNKPEHHHNQDFNPTFSATVGSVTSQPHNCRYCHKQYATNAKLLVNFLLFEILINSSPAPPKWAKNWKIICAQLLQGFFEKKIHSSSHSGQKKFQTLRF